MGWHQIVSCSCCDYKEYWDNYTLPLKFQNIPYNIEYPRTYAGWCVDCGRFTQFIEGIKAEDVKKKKQKEFDSIVSKCNSFINFSSSSKETREILNNIEAYAKIEYAISGKDTVDTCIRCGGTSIIRKDLTRPVWACPKCKRGILGLQEENDGVSIRYGIKEIALPIQHNYQPPTETMVICCYNLIFNENVYLINSGMGKSAALTRENADLRFLDRLSLIWAYIECFYNVNIRETLIEVFEKKLRLRKVVSENVDIKDRLKKRIEYFKKEIEIEKSVSSFIPMAIIKTLRSPNEEPTHKIIGVNPMDAIQNWAVISETIDACFYYLLPDK